MTDTDRVEEGVDQDRVQEVEARIEFVVEVELDDAQREVLGLLRAAGEHVDEGAVLAPFPDRPLPRTIVCVRGELEDGLTAPHQPLRFNLDALEAATSSARVSEPREAVVERLRLLLEGQLRKALVDEQFSAPPADARSAVLRHLFREGLAAERSLGLLWSPESPDVEAERESLTKELQTHLAAPGGASLDDDPLRGRPGWDQVPVGLYLRSQTDLRAFVAGGPDRVLDALGPAPPSPPDPTTMPASAPASMPTHKPAIAPTQPAPRSSAKPETMDLEHYALFYGPEWALDATLLTLLLADVYDLIPAAGPAIGPAFDARLPETIFDPRLDDVIGRPFLQEQISEEAAAIGILLAIAAVGTVDTLKHQDLHHAHNFFLGATTALASTATVTWGLKLGVGRLRPDFRERYVRAACSGAVDTPLELDCAAVDDGFTLGASDVEKGRRSFPSGHSSLSFAAATYLAMHLGSAWIWGDSVPESGAWRTASQVGGAVAATALVSAAGYVAASRVTDNRHHPDDVVLGALIGTGFGAASYLLHFELDGTAKTRGLKIGPTYGDGPGLAVFGQF